MVDLPLERFGRYVVLEPLGQGGTGRVDLALTLDVDGHERFVVLKRPRAERDSDGTLVRILVKEALITALLSHPNLVTVYGLEEDDGAVAIAMEHLDGHSLAELAEEHRASGTRMPIAITLAILSDALLGIDAAHEATDAGGRRLRLVHRDLTPHNIFVTRDGQTKVLDFGIAKLLSESGTETGTATGLIKGKLGYMAPEQILGEKLDRRVDVFAAGIVLWELLAGRRIGRSSSILEVVRCATDPITPLEREVSWIDPELSAIVARAVAVARTDRHATAAELREALEAYSVNRGLFAARADIAAHLDQVLGADARAREERVQRAYPVARRMLAVDEPRNSRVPTLRMPSPPSDAPMTTETYPDPRPPRGVARRVLTIAAVAAASLIGAGAWEHLARSALGALPAPAAKTRALADKHLAPARQESLHLGAEDARASNHTAQGEPSHGHASSPKDPEGEHGDRRAP